MISTPNLEGMTVPQAIADDDHGRRFRHVVCRFEVAADSWSEAKHAKVIGADGLPLETLGSGDSSQCRLPCVGGRPRREGAAALLEFAERYREVLWPGYTHTRRAMRRTRPGFEVTV